MPLTIHQKSALLPLLNATMILRSLGKSLSRKKSLKEFKRKLFEKLDKLTDLLNDGKLTEGHIIASIKALSQEFDISFGQAQKPINVILKYHFYLTRNKNQRTQKVLHCPIDSFILGELNERAISLTKIKDKEYRKFQQEIQNQNSIRIEFDTKWDEQHLRRSGLL